MEHEVDKTYLLLNESGLLRFSSENHGTFCDSAVPLISKELKSDELLEWTLCVYVPITSAHCPSWPKEADFFPTLLNSGMPVSSLQRWTSFSSQAVLTCRVKAHPKSCEERHYSVHSQGLL